MINDLSVLISDKEDCIERARRRAPMSFTDEFEVFLLDETPAPMERMEGATTTEDPARWSQLALLAVMTLAIFATFLYEFEAISMFLRGGR